jgi:hypothetical protein
MITEKNCWTIRQEYAGGFPEIADKCLSLIVTDPKFYFEKSDFLDVTAGELLEIVNHPKLERCTHQERRMIVTKWLRKNHNSAPASGTKAVFSCLEQLQKCPALCDHDDCGIVTAVSTLLETTNTVHAIKLEGRSNVTRKFTTDKVNGETLYVVMVQEWLKTIGGFGIILCTLAVTVGIKLFL